MIFQYGDVLFQKSRGIISRLIRLIISVRYGIPVKYAWSHVFMAVSNDEAISAESDGVRRIKLRGNKELIRADVIGYRFTRPFTEDQLASMAKTEKQITGKRYAYFRYALDFLRVFMFFFILLALVPAAIFYKSLGLYFLGAIALFVVLEKVLGIFDKKTFDCVESVALILMAGGAWDPLAFTSRSEFPDGMLQVFLNLERYDVVTEICNKRIGEDF